MEETQAELQALSERTCKSILEKYKFMVDNISEENFKPIVDLVEAETGKKFEFTFLKIFKTKLYDQIEEKFIKNWKYFEVDPSLSALKFSEMKISENGNKWRPSNHKADDQIRPHLLRNLQRKKALLEKQLGFQTKVIENLVLEVEHHRHRLTNVVSLREKVLSATAQDQEKIKDASQQLDKAKNVLNSLM